MLDSNTFIPSNIIKMSGNKNGFIKEIQKYSTFLLYLLIHNFISPVHHIYKPFLNIYYPINKVYRSDQFECNCITDLSLNIQPTIYLQPLSLYLYGVDRPAHMLSMINGFIVYLHGHGCILYY